MGEPGRRPDRHAPLGVVDVVDEAGLELEVVDVDAQVHRRRLEQHVLDLRGRFEEGLAADERAARAHGAEIVGRRARVGGVDRDVLVRDGQASAAI